MLGALARINGKVVVFIDACFAAEGLKLSSGSPAFSRPALRCPAIEDLVVAGMFEWVSGPALKVVEEYLASVKKYPNPPAPNITQFGRGD
jgi:hypothetical protein